MNDLIYTSEMRIKPEWIDYNGHLNMAYYLVLFDACVDVAMKHLGMGSDYANQTRCSIYTVEAHVIYGREVLEDQPLIASLQLLEHDDKKMHCFEELRHAKDGWLAASLEQVLLHVDLDRTAATPFPENVAARIQALMKAHSALPKPANAGRAVSMRKKGAQ